MTKYSPGALMVGAIGYGLGVGAACMFGTASANNELAYRLHRESLGPPPSSLDTTTHFFQLLFNASLQNSRERSLSFYCFNQFIGR